MRLAESVIVRSNIQQSCRRREHTQRRLDRPTRSRRHPARSCHRKRNNDIGTAGRSCRFASGHADDVDTKQFRGALRPWLHRRLIGNQCHATARSANLTSCGDRKPAKPPRAMRDRCQACCKATPIQGRAIQASKISCEKLGFNTGTRGLQPVQAQRVNEIFRFHHCPFGIYSSL